MSKKVSLQHPWGWIGEGAGFLSSYPVLFSDLPRAMLLPPLIQFISWIFRGVLLLSHLGFFLEFPKFCLLPFMVTSLTPTAHASQCCLLIWLLLGMCLVEGPLPVPSQHLLHMHPAKEFPPPPHLPIRYSPHRPTRQSRQKDWLFTGVTGKPDHPPYLERPRDIHPLWRAVRLSRSVWGAVIS